MGKRGHHKGRRHGGVWTSADKSGQGGGGLASAGRPQRVAVYDT